MQKILNGVKRLSSSAGFAALMVRVFGAGIGFLSHILLARVTTPAEYGVYVFAWTIVILIGTFSSIGLPVASTKFVASYEAKGDIAAYKQFLKFGAALVLAIGGVAAIILAIFVAISPPEWLGEAFKPALMFGAFCVPLFALTEFGKGAARGLGRNVLAYAPGMLLRPIFIGFGVLVLYVVVAQPDAQQMMWVTIAAMVVASLIQWSLIARAPFTASEGEGASVSKREWIMTALPLTVAEAYNLLLGNTDIVILKFFVAPDLLAGYFVAVKIAALLGFIGFAVGATVGKPIAAAHALGDMAKVQSQMRRFATLALLPSLLGYLGLVILGQFVLSLFGASYVSAYPILLLLAGGVVIQAFATVCKFGLAMTGAQKALSLVLAISLVLNIIFNLLFVPMWGVMGAASATVITTILSSIAMLLLVKKRLGFWLMPQLSFSQI